MNNQERSQKENADTEPTSKPSQAEGERDTGIEESSSGTSTAYDGSDQTVEPQPTAKPSQAEGDRDTIDAALRES
jgi:hypothetical protein